MVTCILLRNVWSNILKLISAPQISSEPLIKAQCDYPTVRAHRYCTSSGHLVSDFFFYTERVNEGTFAYSNARKRGKERLTATEKNVL